MVYLAFVLAVKGEFVMPLYFTEREKNTFEDLER
jgi:hypothetical protein